MKCSIVEDDFTFRKLLQIYLSDYGDCFVTVNGHDEMLVCNKKERNCYG